MMFFDNLKRFNNIVIRTSGDYYFMLFFEQDREIYQNNSKDKLWDKHIADFKANMATILL
jgi:hypothetical protein